MIKGGNDMLMDWICRLCSKTFESGVMPEDWRSAVIIPLYKGTRDRNDCQNYRVISC